MRGVWGGGGSSLPPLAAFLRAERPPPPPGSNSELGVQTALEPNDVEHVLGYRDTQCILFGICRRGQVYRYLK